MSLPEMTLSQDRFTVTSAPTQKGTFDFCMDKCGLSPQDIMGVLSEGLPQGLSVNVKIDYDAKYGELLALILNVLDEKSKSAAQDYRLIDIEDKMTWPGAIHVDEAEAGRNIGTTLLFNQMRLVNYMGIEKMQISAGNLTGGAVWGKLGFDLAGKSALNYFNMEVLSRRLEIMEYCLGEDFVGPAYEAYNDGNFTSIWPMTDLTQDVMSFYGEDNTIAMLRMMTEEEVGNEPGKVKTLSVHALARFENRKKISLGQILLVGQQWGGVFDFSSQRQLDRLEKAMLKPLSISTFPPPKLGNAYVQRLALG